MANLTFSDFPAREDVEIDDYFIINRESDLDFPEGRISSSILKDYILTDLIHQNLFFSREQIVNLTVSNNVINIKNDDNSLIEFTDVKKAVNGLFEVECIEFSNEIANSVLCYYDLIWVPVDNKYENITFFSNYVLPINSDVNLETKNFHHLLLPRFLPQTLGNFRLNVRFSQEIQSYKINMKVKMWLFQTY
jgi:hypothetical protein